MDVYDKGLITMLGVGLLMVALAVPLALRKVPRNIVYGYRTRTTLGSDFIWYEANAHFGRKLLIASLCMGLAAFALYGIRPSPGFFLNASIAVLVAPSLVAALVTARFIRTLKNENDGSG